MPVHFILRSEFSWDWPSTPHFWRDIVERGNPLTCFGGRPAVVDTDGPGGRCHRSSDGTASLSPPSFEEEQESHQLLVQHSRERRLGLARRSLTRATNYAVLPHSKLTGTMPSVSGSYTRNTLYSYCTVRVSSILPYSSGSHQEVPWGNSTPSRLESGVHLRELVTQEPKSIQVSKVTAYLAGEHRVIDPSVP